MTVDPIMAHTDIGTGKLSRHPDGSRTPLAFGIYVLGAKFSESRDEIYVISGLRRRCKVEGGGVRGRGKGWSVSGEHRREAAFLCNTIHQTMHWSGTGFGKGDSRLR